MVSVLDLGSSGREFESLHLDNINLKHKAAKTKKLKQQGIKHLSLETAEVLHKKLFDELEKSEEDFLFNYNLNAKENFITNVIGFIDDLIGLERK